MKARARGWLLVVGLIAGSYACGDDSNDDHVMTAAPVTTYDAGYVPVPPAATVPDAGAAAPLQPTFGGAAAGTTSAGGALSGLAGGTGSGGSFSGTTAGGSLSGTTAGGSLSGSA